MDKKMDKNLSVEIQYVGKKGTVYNVVSFEQFERVYKPKGWVLLNKVAEELKKEKSIVEELETTDETEIKNINTMKKKSTKDNTFNDKIIKE